MSSRPFQQVDVFTNQPYRGNPVAVVLDGTELSDVDMQTFATWTNLSETTFVLPPTKDDADYRLRIFTPGGELPFAGHPTLGSAHAWLASGGTPRGADVIVQECGIGLVSLRRTATGLGFRAPELLRDGPLDDEHVLRIAEALRIPAGKIVAHQWVDNGPGWAAVRLGSADEVLALEPDDQLLRELMVGVIGWYPPGSPALFEVRGFAGPVGVREDPVTGSLNAGLASWLIGAGVAPAAYRASQGARLGRRGVIVVESADDGIWVGGDSVTCIEGTVML